MADDFNQMRVDAYHAGNRAAELGLTPQDIATMDWDEYNRLVGKPDRLTPAQMAHRAREAADETRSGASAGNPLPSNAGPPASVSGPPAGMPAGRTLEEIANESEDGFHMWRANRKSGGEGRGIFESVGSQSAEYRDAVARHTGRTAFGREQHHPGITRQFPKSEIPPSGRRQFYVGS